MAEPPDFPPLDLGRASLSLAGRTAIVTGASRGLGKAIALGYAGAGANVVLAARSEQRLRQVADQVRATGREALVAVTDVTDPEQCAQLAERAIAEFGTVDILVNNAGVPLAGASTLELEVDDWDRLMRTNLYSVFYCCKAAGRHMVERGYGKIINMSSQFGLVGYPKRAAYCAAKAGIVNFTRSLAVEWAPHQVCVNALAPTNLATPHNAPVVQDQAFLDEMLPRTPMGRIGRREDVIGAAVFLAAPGSDLVTGQTIAVDAGWTAI